MAIDATETDMKELSAEQMATVKLAENIVLFTNSLGKALAPMMPDNALTNILTIYADAKIKRHFGLG